MGIKKMKDTFYFSHDYNSRQDSKIKKLLQKHGLRGYGIFWAIVEDLYNNANALQADYEIIAYDLHEDSETIKSIVNDFGLFVFDGNFFGSSSVEKRLNERKTRSEKARISAISRWSKNNNNANALQSQSEGYAIKERIGEEKKGNENIMFLTNGVAAQNLFPKFNENFAKKWQTWLSHLTEKGKSPTIGQMQEQIMFLNQYNQNVAEQIISTSLNGGYTALYKPKDTQVSTGIGKRPDGLKKTK